MPTIIDLGVEHDHIESLTKASGITALCELIWNAIDADATEIHINYKKNGLGGYSEIEIIDNGHGLSYEKAKNVFGKLGGSEKKHTTQSPGGRSYHGKEGKGRFKSLALGDLVTFSSTYKDGDSYKTFTIKISNGQLSHSEISDLKQLPKGASFQGFRVLIQNVNDVNAEQGLNLKNRREIEEKYASFWINYQNFKIFFNGNELNFDSLIKNTHEEPLEYEINNLTYSFVIKIIEWQFDNKKKTYFCNTKGIPFLEYNLGIRSSLPISIFIQSIYIEELHRKNTLNMGEMNEDLNVVYNDAKKIARQYLKGRLHLYSKEFIEELKREKIYPYENKPENIVEESTRQVFDIVALQVNEYLPSFGDQDNKGKKLTLSLIKEALESGSVNLKRILSEVIELPKDKQDELADILEDTSLSCIIDTMTEIKNRLNFLQGLEQLIYDKERNKDVKERKHLHKIIVRETWIFGDEYTYGVDDISLKNVLKAYIRDHLQREDFEEVVESEDNNDLQTIPDVCLWQQYSLGKRGKENLVIELKKPTVDAGIKEKGQIEGYAARVASDARFPKDKTRWKFYLITKEIKPELEPLINQKNRKYGHVSEGDNFDVFVLRWGDIITDAKLRHEFIKEKLNITLQDNNEGLEYLRTKYKEYLPENFGEETQLQGTEEMGK
jgi:hypothetical protein